MNIENAIQRLHWRVSQGKHFKPNENDEIAIDFMVDWVNAQKEKTVQENRIFAKMYVVLFGEFMMHYKDIETAQTQIHKELSSPLENHFEWFNMKLNALENEKYMKSLGYSPMQIFNSKDDPNIMDIQKINKWDLDKTSKSLENQISEAINKFKNLP